MKTFEISDSQEKKYEHWNKKHKKKCSYINSGKQAAEGARLTYSFTPTGFGLIVEVKCACDDKIDLTESGNW